MPTPTIGRVVYYRPSLLDLQNPAIVSLDLTQPFSAYIGFVNSDTAVNLQVIDHLGRPFSRDNVPFFDAQQPDTEAAHAHWMPYQLQQQAGQPATPAVA
jgi:hypothetical protein